MYRAGKLASRPNSLHLYVARPQTWSPEIAVLLQEQPTPKFAWGGVDFEINPIWSVPGKAMRYSIRHGSGETNLHVVIVNSVIACGPRSNIDLTYHSWTTFDFYCTNYAIVVLPSQTLGDKIVYLQHYLAEMVGDTTRRCGNCVCMLTEPHPYYDVGCRKPEKCTCVLCCMQPPSLKAAASEIVFRMCNKEKLCLDLVSSCRPVDPFFHFEFG